MQTGSSEILIGWKSEKTLMSLYGTEWRERGYGPCGYDSGLVWLVLPE